MQSSEQKYFFQKPHPPPTDQGGDNNGYLHNDDNTPFSSLFGGVPNAPFQNVNFQPSDACLRNFIIFDQTDNRSQIMFHPGLALAQNSCYPTGLNLNIGSSPWLLQDNLKTNEILCDRREISISSSIMKEDSDDIEALLSFEEEKEEEGENEYDEEEVSTARTCNYGSDSDSADSCSSKPRKKIIKLPTSSKKSTGSGKSRSSGERKRQKMRKMVKVLRGIVPSSNRRMNSVDVLDEAVRYLKSLKVEVQKFRVGNLKN